MVDFSQLAVLEVGQQTVDYEVYQIAGEPILKLLPASESTKPYFNALLRKSGKKVRAMQSSRFSGAMIKENRAEDRILYAHHIIKGWSNVTDANGQAVEFSAENVLDFLNALPDWIFEEIRRYASDIQNFINEGEESLDVEEVAKN